MKLKRRFWWVNPEMLRDAWSSVVWPFKQNDTQVRVEIRLAPVRRGVFGKST